MTTKLPSFDEIVAEGRKTFLETYKSDPEIYCCAPGRVNIIGEHVDYCDGYVLPMALPMVTVFMGSINNTESSCEVTTCSKDADEPRTVKFDTKTLKPGKPSWANYIKGVIHSFGKPVPGFNAVIISNVPVGGGLSSSAALEVSTLIFIEQLCKSPIEKKTDKALICQKAEHTFASMPCGIMDQLISVMGTKSHLLLIDCKSLETLQIPFESKDLTILICNSNVRHTLSSSEYPKRREECSKALKMMGLKSYRDATEKDLQVLQRAKEEVLLKRARHVITEIKRTHEAAEVLRAHDFKKMGELMKKSHISLRDDFQVSCKELDILVDCAINCPGVLGSRMTGGGFGGCTVTLLQNESVDKVISTMQKAFKTKCNGRADFYVCTPSDGARSFHL